MFLVIITYKKPIEVIDSLIGEHTEFLDKNYKDHCFIFSGRQNPRTGGIILVNLDNEEDVKEVISEDPFFIHEAADYTFIKFIPTKYDERFSCFIE